MSDDLEVTTEELTRIGNKQRDVATGIGAAEAVTDGATLTVGRTHGAVCSLTIAALGEAQALRSAAAQALQNLSNELAARLDTAAAEYRRTDQQQEANLDAQLRPD